MINRSCTYIAIEINRLRYVWGLLASKISLVCDWREYVLKISSSLNKQQDMFEVLHLVRNINYLKRILVYFSRLLLPRKNILLLHMFRDFLK